MAAPAPETGGGVEQVLLREVDEPGGAEGRVLIRIVVGFEIDYVRVWQRAPVASVFPEPRS